LDYDGSFEISGGTLMGASSSGMAQATSESSSQRTVSMTFTQAQQAGTLVRLEDSKGNAIVTFAPGKTYQSVVISSPELKEGETYTLFSGGTVSGTEVEVSGYYGDGEYTGGTEITSFEMTGSVIWLNESGVTTGNSGGFGGGPGGQRGGMGGRPEGQPGEMGSMPEGAGSGRM
jgi:hypothetical protein